MRSRRMKKLKCVRMIFIFPSLCSCSRILLPYCPLANFTRTTVTRTRFFLLIAPARTLFFVSFWRSRRGLGSRRLCGRRRKPRLEPDVRSSRFVIVREIPNATPFRVATFTGRRPRSIKCQTRRLSELFPIGTTNRKNGV